MLKKTHVDFALIMSAIRRARCPAKFEIALEKLPAGPKVRIQMGLPTIPGSKKSIGR
jgi:hypothetical protein